MGKASLGGGGFGGTLRGKGWVWPEDFLGWKVKGKRDTGGDPPEKAQPRSSQGDHQLMGQEGSHEKKFGGGACAKAFSAEKTQPPRKNQREKKGTNKTAQEKRV